MKQKTIARWVKLCFELSKWSCVVYSETTIRCWIPPAPLSPHHLHTWARTASSSHCSPAEGRRSASRQTPPQSGGRLDQKLTSGSPLGCERKMNCPCLRTPPPEPGVEETRTYHFRWFSHFHKEFWVSGRWWYRHSVRVSPSIVCFAEATECLQHQAFSSVSGRRAW